jgi:FkbM family methyltransferase
LIDRAINFARRFAPDPLAMRPQVLTLSSGVRVKIDSRLSLDLFVELFVTQPYNKALELTTNPKMVLDLGANRGFFSLSALHFLIERGEGRETQFVCVEAARQNVRRLQDHALLNASLGQLNPVHGAVCGDRSGTAHFYYAPQAHGMGQVLASPRITTTEVPIVDVSALTGNATIDVLKLDIEGSEQEFLEGYPDLLERTGVLVGEFHLKAIDYGRCRELLEANGLRFVTRTFAHGDELCVDVFERSR